MTSTHRTKRDDPQAAAHAAARSGHAASNETDLPEQERKDIAREFNGVVNMTPSALRKWLGTDDAKRVGFKREGSETESVGHQSGLYIIEILGKPAKELTDADYRHMRKVVGYVHRHLAQGPTKQEVETSDWRYSLMNWGHDPLES